jgi:hypothetical protein
MKTIQRQQSSRQKRNTHLAINPNTPPHHKKHQAPQLNIQHLKTPAHHPNSLGFLHEKVIDVENPLQLKPRELLYTNSPPHNSI